MPNVSDLPPPPSLDLAHGDEPVALFLDFDGTLVELADTPDGIAVPERLAERLLRLATSLNGALALVSGRAVIDLERHCGPLAVARAGSHGVDRRLADGSMLGAAPQFMPPAAETAVRRFAKQHDLQLEIKPHGSALHYRANPEAGPAGQVFATDLAAEYGLIVKTGKFVIELVQPGVDKGAAVRAFMNQAPFAKRRPLFVGDDVTDEDGFAAVRALGGYGVIVGDRAPSAARYRLSDPAAVHAWLAL